MAQDSYSELACEAEEYFQLAEGFTSGQRGFPQDETEGVMHYRMAAELGHHQAQHEMGRIYKNSDPVQAYEWFLEASLLKNTDAMFELHWCYLNGKGVEEEIFEEAIKAADCNHPEACCEYGRRLKKGDGVEKDPKKALDYFHEAESARGLMLLPEWTRCGPR